MGDIVYVDLPPVGTQVRKSKPVCGIESVKSAADVYAPMNGEIVDVNVAVADDPSLVNSDPYNKGWLVKLQVDSLDTNDLLSPSDYERHKAESSH
ncbi:hypothetical protein RCL1_003438 [Eukaryota sp. TZLM3-RCL]